MSTYGEIITDAQKLTDTTGQTDIQEMMEAVVIYALKYIATKVTVPELRAVTSYTYLSTDDTIPIGGGGFAISNFTTPIRLYVNDIPHDYREYLEWLDLQSAPGGFRWSINQTSTVDLRPSRCWTINPSNEVEIYPLPVEDDVIKLVHAREPAAYSSGGTPELNARFHVILMNACVIAAKEFLRDPDAILDLNALFQALDPQITELSIHQDSLRVRRGHRISSRYST